ncbi:hypothetical protein [Nonomuraea angiospora]|uniref:hypothetical protein n=1 Tax=Nonomuraea angiospora TaxID=46172 RepID=UPI0029B703DE|nr:hypothetical protein [Nonomuraea angiospora]MDX3111389.1 hypothetical protein [Nonomuraea angiospora]
MTVTTRTAYTVRCETCPAEYEALDAVGPVDARLLAAIAGWRTKDTRLVAGTAGRTLDYCPTCEVPT